MFCGRIFSMLMAFLSISLLLMALSTDYWIVSFGPAGTAHSGLWQFCMNLGAFKSQCETVKEPVGYITATRAFLILASLTALALHFFLIATFAPSMFGILGKPLVASVAAYVAGLFTLIALTVYTAETWKEKPPSQIQVSFAWSFYSGWIAFPLFLLAGAFNHVASLNAPSASYERI
ncbi:protein NKG7-like isoform X1 [Crotalus tigris]|uniref:protein NKG7-like isoform X1 n=1 Tax=Crotalus tigris TaxID=88082 RepID=UPI00192F6C2D|nr:protein NKG7-like isoform X1 [Crotalus tigris]XP_039178620.1 protein NKG7-like isoform X1 [Crotalus tigris]